MPKNGDIFIGWKQFIATMTIIFAILGLLYTKVDKNVDQISDIKVSIGSIDTKLEFITDKIKNGKEIGVKLFGPVVYKPDFEPDYTYADIVPTTPTSLMPPYDLYFKAQQTLGKTPQEIQQSYAELMAAP